MKKLIIGALCAIGVTVSAVTLYNEYRAYRTMQAMTAQMWQWMVTEVGTRTDDKGATVPVSRADVVALVAAERLKAHTPTQ